MKKILITNLVLLPMLAIASDVGASKIQWAPQDKEIQKVWEKIYSSWTVFVQVNWSHKGHNESYNEYFAFRKETPKVSPFLDRFIEAYVQDFFSYPVTAFNYNSTDPEQTYFYPPSTAMWVINKIAPLLFGSAKVTPDNEKKIREAIAEFDEYGLTQYAPNTLIIINEKLLGKPSLKPVGAITKPQVPKAGTELEKELKKRELKKEIEKKKQVGPDICSGAPSLWESTKPLWSQINALLRKNKASAYEKWSKDDKDLIQDIESKIGQSHPLYSFLKHYYKRYDQMNMAQREQLIADMNSIAPDMFNDTKLNDVTKKKIETVLRKHFDANQVREIMEIIQRNR